MTPVVPARVGLSQCVPRDGVPAHRCAGAVPLHTEMHVCNAAGVPLKPMLASITEGVPDALKQLGVEDGLPFLAEYKYDGIRAQVSPCCKTSHNLCRSTCNHSFVGLP